MVVLLNKGLKGRNYKMKTSIARMISFLCIMCMVLSTTPPITTKADTMSDKVSKTIAFGEYDEITFVKDQPTIVKIVLKDKGSFDLDFNPSYVYFLVAKLYDEDYNLVYSSPAQGVHADEVTPSFMNYNSDLPAGTYYLWMSSDKDATYSYFTRQIPAQDITIEMCITLEKGKTIQLGTIFTNSKNTSVKWSSSKKNVATVNSKGKVKGIKKGTTTIKAYNSSGLVTKIKIKVID